MATSPVGQGQSERQSFPAGNAEQARALDRFVSVLHAECQGLVSDRSAAQPDLPIRPVVPSGSAAAWDNGTVRRWENAAAGRYYEARLVRDLFGDWQVLRAWGGIGTALGAARFDPLPGPNACASEFEQIDKRRAQRGYVLRP